MSEKQGQREQVINPFQEEHLGHQQLAKLTLTSSNWQSFYEQIQHDIEIVPPDTKKVLRSFRNLIITFIDGVNILKETNIDHTSETAIHFSKQMAEVFLKLRARLKNHPAKAEVDQLLKSELGNEIVTANDILQTFKTETTLPFGTETLIAEHKRQRMPFINISGSRTPTGTTTQTQQSIKKTLRPPSQEVPTAIQETPQDEPIQSKSSGKLKKAALWFSLAAGVGLAGIGISRSTVTDSTTEISPQTQQPEPGAKENAEPNRQPTKAKDKNNNVKIHLGVDRNSEGYQKFIKYFAKNGMSSFNEAMSNAARQTRIEVSADTDKDLLPFITYRTTLENCKKGARGFFLEYCNIRLQQLDREIERLKKEGKKITPENVFTSDTQFGDKLAFEAFASYAELPDPSTLAGYAVETDMKKNPALQRFHNRFAGPTGAPAYYQVIHTALTRIEQQPCTTPEITECVFERAFEVAAEESAKAKKQGVSHGAASIIRIEHNNFKNGRVSRINDISQTYNVIKKDGEKPSTPKIESNSPVETMPAIAPQPVHTKNDVPLWTDQEDKFFATGEKISAENTDQQIENNKMVSENPELFYYPEQAPKKKGLFATAAAKFASKITDTAKKVFTKKELSPEQQEMAELKKSIPKKSLFHSLFG